MLSEDFLALLREFMEHNSDLIDDTFDLRDVGVELDNGYGFVISLRSGELLNLLLIPSTWPEGMKEANAPKRVDAP